PWSSPFRRPAPPRARTPSAPAGPSCRPAGRTAPPCRSRPVRRAGDPPRASPPVDGRRPWHPAPGARRGCCGPWLQSPTERSTTRRTETDAPDYRRDPRGPKLTKGVASGPRRSPHQGVTDLVSDEARDVTAEAGHLLHERGGDVLVAGVPWEEEG